MQRPPSTVLGGAATQAEQDKPAPFARNGAGAEPRPRLGVQPGCRCPTPVPPMFLPTAPLHAPHTPSSAMCAAFRRPHRCRPRRSFVESAAARELCSLACRCEDDSRTPPSPAAGHFYACDVAAVLRRAVRVAMRQMSRAIRAGSRRFVYCGRQKHIKYNCPSIYRTTVRIKFPAGQLPMTGCCCTWTRGPTPRPRSVSVAVDGVDRMSAVADRMVGHPPRKMSCTRALHRPPPLLRWMDGHSLLPQATAFRAASRKQSK